MNADVKAELSRRIRLWDALMEEGADALPPRLLNDLRVYRGQAGIYADKDSTKHLSDDGTAVAVSVLHSDHHFPNDHDPEGLTYHYPETDRSPSHDAGEIAALKNACELRLPVFTVIRHGRLREVRLSWVEGWDDRAKVVLITFGQSAPQSFHDVPADDQFSLEAIGEAWANPTIPVRVRRGQRNFKFRVEAHYGAACAVCGWDLPNVLQAAHIWPKSENGTDDPRNGLPLCPNHHVAFDAGLWAIDPDLRIVTLKNGPNLKDLGIKKTSLHHLPHRPHPEAIMAAWEKWKASAR